MRSQIEDLLGSQKHPVIVDVGAYTGQGAKAYAKQYPNGTIYAIEACPINYKILQKRVSSLKNVVPCNCAISDVSGVIPFYYASRKKIEGTSQCNSLYEKFVSKKSWVDNSKMVEVQALTMDDFYKAHKIDRVTLLDINAEGAEYQIFPGDLDFLKRTDMIYVMFHCKKGLFSKPEFEQKRSDIYARLKNAGLSMVCGVMATKSDKHIPQLWTKP